MDCVLGLFSSRQWNIDLFCAIVCTSYLFTCPKVHLSIEMTDSNVTRSQSSMNIENLTSIPVGGSITLINYAHRHLPTECSPAKDRGWAWVVCAGSFFVMFMVYGIHTSFGVLLVVLLDHFDSNKASTGKNFMAVIQNQTASAILILYSAEINCMRIQRL